jgi:hypothetical protein
MNRRNQILVGLFVLQLIVAAIILWPRPTATAEGENLFPELDTGQIVGLTVTDASGETIRLAKENGTWVLPMAGGYPVQADTVSEFLTKIAALRAERMVAQTASSHARLKVAGDDYERLVELEMSDGTRHHFYIGTSPSFSVSHIRSGDQDQVYLTSEISAQDAGAQASNWIDRTYLEVPKEQSVAVTLENANGTFTFTKEGETWAMQDLAQDENLNQTAVETLVNRAALVTMIEPLGTEDQASYGLQAPSAVVTLQTRSEEAGERTYTLRVGAQDPDDDSYVVLSSESPYYVRVSQFAVEDLVDKDREGFLELPPTPEATPEATPASP